MFRLLHVLPQALFLYYIYRFSFYFTKNTIHIDYKKESVNSI